MHVDRDIVTLIAEIRACTACAGLPLGPNPIFQAGAGARILVVGQAPGRIAHHRSRPFDDISGDRLRAWLGVDRATFYDPGLVALVPMGFCYPGTGRGGDLPPRPECAPLWRVRLLRLMPEIRLTLLLGRHALEWHSPQWRGRPLAEAVTDWRAHWPERLALPHPSPRNARWLRDNPIVEAEILPALRERVRGLLETGE